MDARTEHAPFDRALANGRVSDPENVTDGRVVAPRPGAERREP